MPKGYDFNTAAAIPLTGLTAYQAIAEELEATPGETLLIPGGSGSFGQMAVPIANDLPNPILRVTIQAAKRHEKRSPSLSAKDTGKGWEAFLTTESTTHRPGPHGNSMVKEAQR